jgi:hypothetical protein
MLLVMKENEALDVVPVGLLSSQTQVFEPRNGSNLIQKFWWLHEGVSLPQGQSFVSKCKIIPE